jgi:hypothetical protein
VGTYIPEPVLNMNNAILDQKIGILPYILLYNLFYEFMDTCDDDKNYINPQESGVDYSIERVGLLTHK